MSLRPDIDALYDDACGVIAKALIGNGQPVSSQDVDAEAADRLGLDFNALVGLEKYTPNALQLGGVQRLDLPFEDDFVNAWLIQLGDITLLFDAGFLESDLKRALDGKHVEQAFITHAHRDHIGGLSFLKSRDVLIHDADRLTVASVFQIGGLKIEVVKLDGHFTPSFGFLIHGLEREVFVVGDALYAGSIGKCFDRPSYREALVNLRKAFENLSSDCVLLPGHGPATTVGEELAHNPFL